MKHAQLLTLFIAFVITPALLAQTENPEPGGEKKHSTVLKQVNDVPGLPRVLIIGDSISIGYTKPVSDLLKGRANVHRIPANGNATSVGLEKLAAWLGDEKWDVIHFNWGLHDLKHWKNDKMDMSAPKVNTEEQYEKNLRELVNRLKATGAKIIWATTTPVPVGSPGRDAGEEIKYNAIAERVMKENKVPIDDLHAAVMPRIKDLQKPKNVHFTNEGYDVLAEKVATSITEQLNASVSEK